MPERPLAGRNALVTGASRERGIGAAICRELARQGCGIAFSHWRAYDRTMPWGSEDDFPARLADELRAAGVPAIGIESDLSDPAAPAQLLDAAVAALGPLHILVNNATHSTNDGWEHLDAATLDAHYVVNLRANVLLSVEFVKRYPGGPGGRIISFSSGQSLDPMPSELAYAATKGAIEALTSSLAAGVAHLGITVNAINPGPTQTGWMGPDLVAELLPRFPAGRIGQPEDAARLAAFLATDAAAWITGQVIHSEGGFSR